MIPASPIAVYFSAVDISATGAMVMYPSHRFEHITAQGNSHVILGNYNVQHISPYSDVSSDKTVQNGKLYPNDGLI